MLEIQRRILSVWNIIRPKVCLLLPFLVFASIIGGLSAASWAASFLASSALLLALCASGFVRCMYFDSRADRMIDALSRAAREASKGNLPSAVPAGGDDQIGRLGTDFNAITRHLRLLRDRESEALRIERDLNLAGDVQACLTPTKHLALLGGTVWSTSTPARHVSGDLHDVHFFSPSRAGLICADLSGKGIPSALLTAHLQGLIHAHLCSPNIPSPAALAQKLNRDLLLRSEQHRYATFFYGEVDLKKRALKCVNAGHCHPLLITKGGARFLSESDIPLGLFSEASFHEFEVPIAGPATLVVYTDGITEALNAQGKQFGEERLLRCAVQAAEISGAASVGKAIRAEAADWSREVEQFDDATLLVLQLQS